MKTFGWLIAIMDITLILLLWLYIYDLYIQNRVDVLEYHVHIFNSDEAIPIIGLGVLLNTGALIFLIRNACRKRRGETREEPSIFSPQQPKHTARQDEIQELEDDLENVVDRLEDLRKSSGEGS